jgi:hypothetical protein
MSKAIVTPAQHEAIEDVFLRSDRQLSAGLGSVNGERCTIAEINLILTGRLTDSEHKCMSNVIRHWVIDIQDLMPADVRNSDAWRKAAVGIAGSAASAEVEEKRNAMILDWMWDALADETVRARVPLSLRPAWEHMIATRTPATAYDVVNTATRVARGFTAPRAVTYAADAANEAAYVAGGQLSSRFSIVVVIANAWRLSSYANSNVSPVFWQNIDPAGMLQRLIDTV